MSNNKITKLLCVILVLCGMLTTNICFSITASADASETVTPIQTTELDFTNWETSDEAYVSLETQKKHFSEDENITVAYYVNSDDYITDISYTQIGFSVINASIDNYDSNRILVELSCIPNSDVYSMFININLSSGEALTSMLYATVNEYGAFISPFSEDDALERYFDFAKASNIMSQTEYEVIKSELSRRCIVEESIIESNTVNVAATSTMSTSTETYVGGTLQWIDDFGNYHPLRRVMVELYDRESVWNTPLATAYSDNNGYYSFTFDNNDNTLESGGKDIFIRVYAGDSNAMVKNSIAFNYYCDSEVYENVSTGSFLPINITINMSTDTGKAFQISQAILTARDYAWNMIGEMPDDVAVFYPVSDGCYYNYNEIFNFIEITGNARLTDRVPHSYASWDVIMHEYGHHIQYQMEIIDSPHGDHTFNSNLCDKRNNKDEGIRLAWAEAWPTVFGMMAQDYWSSYLQGIKAINDSTYDAYNFDDPHEIENSIDDFGEGCEASIIAILWDLYDGVNIEVFINDTISLSHEQYWAVTTGGNESKTFSGFISHFYSVYPEYVDDIGVNLTHHKLATTVPVMQNSPILAEDVPPRFTWEAQGGSSNFPNNSFSLIFYDGSGNEVLRTNATTSTSYTLTQDEWTTIINNCGGYFTVAVSAMQMHEPQTGQYISQRSNTFRREDIHFHTYAHHYEQLSGFEHNAFCSCGLNRIESHDYSTLTNISDTEHRPDCACGQQGTVTEAHYAHSYSSLSSLTHRIFCACGKNMGIGTHNMMGIGFSSAVCVDCGYVGKQSSGNIIMGKENDTDLVAG